MHTRYNLAFYNNKMEQGLNAEPERVSGHGDEMDDFFGDSDDNLSPPKMSRIFNMDRITIFNVPYENACLLLMKHPVSVTLYKYVEVTVLSGIVSINGYELKRGKFINVFSSEKTGLVAIKTESAENIWLKTKYSAHLTTNLRLLFPSEKMINDILRYFEKQTIAVFIKRCCFPPHIEFAENYCPEPFKFRLANNKRFRDTLYLPQTQIPVLQFDEKVENLAHQIGLLLRRAKLINDDFPRILVYGPRNSGKSSLLRFLINRMLSEFHNVCYLDTDPGQPEFTPPGVVSLTKVGKPVIGPPFLHQKKNAHMIFTGDVSPSFADLYRKSICKLMKLYREKYSKEGLFVNTMGWVQGRGLLCLIDTIITVKPTILIEIVPKGETSMFDYREYLTGESNYFQICSRPDIPHSTSISPKVMREVSLLTHFGKRLSPVDEIVPIYELGLYQVPWEKAFTQTLPPIVRSRIYQALIGSIVALCRVPEKCVLKSKKPDLPHILEYESENEFLAYGLVQCVNERDKLLYIASPLKDEEWIKVNALIKGNVQVPNCVMLKQELYHTELPFIAADSKKSASDEEENMDVSMLSLKYLSEKEDDSPELKEPVRIFPSVENFRKPVNFRHRKKFSKRHMRK